MVLCLLMQLRLFCVIGFISLLASNLYALVMDIFWLNIFSHIGFYIIAFIFFIKEHKSYNFYFYFFIICKILSYLLQLFYEVWFFKETFLLLQAVSYLALIMEVTKHFNIKHINFFMLLYFFSIIGLNTYLLFSNINEMSSTLYENGVSLLYAFYYLNLGVLGITAIVYYVNSFSTKSMYFITLVICIIFANILRDTGLFYFKDISVEIAESVIRMGSALFLVLFFITSEKRLTL